jgi:hypothetical protein
VVDGALEVPKNAHRDREMGLTGVVYVEAHLLDRVGNVEPGEGEVLKSPNQAAHASTLNDVPSIMTLVEEETIRLLLY